KNKIAFCGLLMKRARHRIRRPQAFRQRLGYVAQRISGAAGDDEIAFSEKGARLVPFGDIAEGVNSDQEKEAIGFLERSFQVADGVDRIIHGGGASSNQPAGSGRPYVCGCEFWSLQQRGPEMLFVLGC